MSTVPSRISSPTVESQRPGPRLVQRPSFTPPPAAHSHRRVRIAATVAEVVVDLLTTLAATFAAYGTYRLLVIGKHVSYPPHRLAVVALATGVAMVALLERNGGYRTGSSLLRVRETEGILRASTQCACLALVVSYFSQQMFSRGLVAISFVYVPFALIGAKQIGHWAVAKMNCRGYGVERVIIYGAGPTGRRLFSAFVRSPKLGLEPVALIDDDRQTAGAAVHENAYRRQRSAPVIPGPLTQESIHELQADRVVIAIPSVTKDKFLDIANEARAAGASISFVPYHFGGSALWTNYEEIDGVLLASIGDACGRRDYEVGKRVVDLLLAASLIALTAPLLAVIALAIKLTDRGPIIFVQDRVGRFGKIFRVYKFRTMYTHAPAYDFSPHTARDPRIMPVGRFLRRTSLDELPQLFNVLKGDMSVVGPRPEMPFIVDTYKPIHRQRLVVKPGITGLWQLSADRAHPIHENLEYDLYYIRHRNVFIDVAIVLHTVAFAARGI